jgi:Asp/Glu/hydantoin racemase
MQSTVKIGVTHTSPATVELFGRLLRDRISGATVVNLLDDSILPELRDNGGYLAAVEPRWRSYVRILSEQGVDLILNACSSIGELCARAQVDIVQPIVRVDAGMARDAVRRGTRISVIATLPTTLRPTGDLLQHAAAAEGRHIVLDSVLVEGAYAALMANDQRQHDDLITEALQRATDANDAVVLAQASMGRVVAHLAHAQQEKVLSSPRFAVEDVARILHADAFRP